MAKLSKNLKEAEKRFEKALKNHDSEEIAIASAEILMYDKKYSSVLTCQLMLAGRILKKLEAGEVKPSKLNSRQIRAFVIQEWETMKSRKKSQKGKIDLSEEQERRVISGLARALRKLKKEQEKEKNKKS
jgi:hypothetical protein